MVPPVARLAIAYGAGLWTGLVFSIPGAMVWSAGAVTAVVLWRRPVMGALLAVAILGAVTGWVRAGENAESCSRRLRPGPHALTLAVHDATGSRGTTTATVWHGGCRGTLRIRLNDGTVPAGSRAVAVGVVRPGGVMRVSHVRVLRAPRSRRFVVRDAVARRVRALYGARAGLVEAMVIGRREDIPVSLRREFTDAGLAHLLAISGLHVGLLAAWLLVALTRVVRRPTAWLICCVLIWGYVSLLGFPAPATRAAGFLSIHAVSRARQRHPPSSAVLAVALLAVLLIEPSAATAVGAWLSVAAVWGTGAAGALLQGRLARRPLVRLAAASAGATLATAPVTAFAFGSVALAGLVTNLVAVPLAGIAVPGVVASLVLGDLAAGGAGLVLAAIESVARAGAALPLGHVSGVGGPAFAAPWLALAAAAFYVARTRPSWRRLGTKLLGWSAALSWLLVAVAIGERGDRGGDLAIHILDVGQGDAIAIRTPRGSWLLVDGGPLSAAGDAGRRVVVPFLERRGVRRLAALIVSHGDADHLGGVPSVLSRIDAGLVLEPGQPLASNLYLEFLAALDGRGLEWRAARTGDTLVVDSVVVAVIHPSAQWMRGQLVPNENSVVLKLSYGCFEAVLAGDVGHPVEERLLASVGQADLLKVGHHGSAGSTGAEWLAAVRPAAAVISVGRNSYGHPAPVVLERLRQAGTPVWRTDRGGAVTIRSDGRYLKVTQGGPTTAWEGLRCWIRHWLRSSGSSSSRSACTPRPPASLHSCSTTSRSPQR